MELRLPLEMSPGREAACRAVFGTSGFFPNDARKNCPFVLTLIHRLEFGEVSGHRVLIKRGPGNRGPTECGTTHEATDRKSTRLNSSHQLLSYAVFCLKKKRAHARNVHPTIAPPPAPHPPTQRVAA